jgi:hypothetical protein
MADSKDKGVSLAKGPVGLLGLALLAFGILALIFGSHSFTAHPLNGNVNGKQFLGIETNGWSSLLFIAAGALLIFGAPMHWGAKSMSLIVGLALGAASVIALVDKRDVFGIFAANGPTKLIWGVASAVLLVLALLPRVGGGKKDNDRDDRPAPRRRTEPVVERDPQPTRRVERDVATNEGSRTGSRVVAPASGTTPESQETTRRQRNN